MSVLFFLIPLGLLFVGGALGAFHWAARDGQFDDLHTPSIRVLLDDET
jgi:cbb3-type cytochrome oxidase maturation protein